MNGLKKLGILFENCEIAEIDGKYIGEIDIDDIVKSVTRTASNSIEKITSCKHFSVNINRRADNLKNLGTVSEYESFFERFMYRDIVAVSVLFDSDKGKSLDDKKWIFVPYEESETQSDIERIFSAYNTYMTVKKNDFGDLHICIDEKVTADDIFPDEEYNEKEYVDYMWEMYMMWDNKD